MKLLILLACAGVAFGQDAAKPAKSGAPMASVATVPAVAMPTPIALPSEILLDYFRQSKAAAEAETKANRDIEAARALAEKQIAAAKATLQSMIDQKMGPFCTAKKLVAVFSDAAQAKELGLVPGDPICAPQPPQ